MAGLVVVARLIALVPASVYLVVGGFPSTRGLQKVMSGPVGAGLVVVGLLAGLVVALSQVPGLVRALRDVREPVWHEVRIRPAGRLATVATSLLSTVVLLVGLVRAGGDGTQKVVRNYHVLDALSSAMFLVGLTLLAVAVLAVLFPPAAPALAFAGVEAAEGATAAAAASAAVVSQALTQGATLTLRPDAPPSDQQRRLLAGQQRRRWFVRGRVRFRSGKYITFSWRGPGDWWISTGGV